MKQLHEVQLQILKKLLFSPNLTYSKLKPDPEMENNQFTFHLDQVVNAGYVEKRDKGYSLTSSGKEFANRMDTERINIGLQAKISAWICCIKTRGKNQQYLIYTRLKHPFYGCQGLISGKVQYGETVFDAAQRELLEETGLSGKAQVVLINHFLVHDKASRKLVEDKFMFMCLVKNPKGELNPQSEEGKYEWVAEADLRSYITYPFEPLEEFLNYLKETKRFKGKPKLQEIIHYTEKF